MNKTKQKSSKKSKGKTLTEKRQNAAKIKAKKELFRRKHPQKATSKGFSVAIYQHWQKNLGLRDLLNAHIYYKKPKNSTYSVVDMIIALCAMVCLGLKRVYHAKEYQQETLLAKQLKLKKFSSDTTCYRFLKNYGQLTLTRQIEKVNSELVKPKLEASKLVIVDSDWSTLRSYENDKQGSCPGYNKLRPGQNCFQALNYFANGFSIHSSIIEGNKVPVKEFEFITDLRYVRKRCARIDWLRLDSGFLSQKALKNLDEFSCYKNSREKVRFIANVGMIPVGAKTAKRQSKCRPWTIIKKGVQLQDHGFVKIYKEDKVKHRLILLRKRIKDKKGKRKWQYYPLVTNEKKMNAVQLYHFYMKRQVLENFYDEAKNEYHIQNLPCSKLMGNNLYFSIVCFTFNLLIFFKNDILTSKYHNIRITTLQRKFLNADIFFDGSSFLLLRSVPFYRIFILIFYRVQNQKFSFKYQLC
jgi:hypothetical protein